MSHFAQTSNFDLHFLSLTASESRSILVEDIRVPHHEIKAKVCVVGVKKEKNPIKQFAARYAAELSTWLEAKLWIHNSTYDY